MKCQGENWTVKSDHKSCILLERKFYRYTGSVQVKFLSRFEPGHFVIIGVIGGSVMLILK